MQLQPTNVTLHKEILQLLSQHPYRLKVSDFNGVYWRYYCKNLVLSKHGFKKLTALFKAMKDYVDIVEFNGEQFVKVKSESIHLDQSPASWQHDKPHHSCEEPPGTSLLKQHDELLMSEENHNVVIRKPFSHVVQGQDQVQQQAINRHPTSTETDLTGQLKAFLQDLMKKHPEGVPLTEVRRSCSILYHPDILNNFASMKLLLASLTDVVQLKGIGVQTYVHPAAVQAKGH
ncbi:hypothetical protein GN956_G14440 [Arapaima gigas]